MRWALIPKEKQFNKTCAILKIRSAVLGKVVILIDNHLAEDMNL